MAKRGTGCGAERRDDERERSLFKADVPSVSGPD
jgi:hypothetical protein